MQSVGERGQGLERNLSNFSYIFLLDVKFENLTVGSQIVAHTLIETGNGPNRPNTINL